MCRYHIGQKIEMWRIQGGKYPHRVLSRRVVTIRTFLGKDNHGDIRGLVAVDCRRRVYIKTRPQWTALGLLELRPSWGRFGGPRETWVEAVVALTHAFHSSRPFHYSDGHGHEMKPTGRFQFCRKHHLFTHRGWQCVDRGMPAHHHNHLPCYSETG